MPRNRLARGLEMREGPRGVRYRAGRVRLGDRRRSKPGPWRTSIAAARADLHAALAGRDAGALPEQVGGTTLPTFRAAAEAWLDCAERGEALARGRGAGGRRTYAPKTLRGYRRDLELYVFPRWGDRPIDRVRRPEIQQLVDEIAASHSGQRARNVATPVQALYRFLLPRHDDLTDPTVGLDLPAASAPRERIASPDELLALLHALEERDRVVLALAGMAGLRAGEIRALQRMDVGDDEIVVRWSWDAVAGRVRPKSRAGRRTVPTFAALSPILNAWIDRTAGLPLDWPFVPGTGSGRRSGERDAPISLEGCRNRATRAWKRAGVEPLGLHEARHSFASHLVLAGYDVATVAAWIGHSSPSFTLDRYVKPLRQRGLQPEAVRAYLGVA